MAMSREDTSRKSRWPARVVVLAGVLFPLLVAGGVLAPQIISLMAETEIANSPIEQDA